MTWWIVDQTMYSQKISHLSSSGASCGAYIVSILMNFHHVVVGTPLYNFAQVKLQHSLKSCHDTAAMAHTKWLVSIGSGNGLVP